VRKLSEGEGPGGEKTIVQLIHDGQVDLIVNTPSHCGSSNAGGDGHVLRAAAVARAVPCLTTVRALAAAVQAIDALHHAETGVRSLQEACATLARLLAVQRPEEAGLPPRLDPGLSYSHRGPGRRWWAAREVALPGRRPAA
ncbi:hypothetical protein, partial [Streptomyces vinaceus]|uniref:hypothetical protein n=1 Tax=Streptomyces vinaceus TaxID=1960 RepID=UPI00367CAF45